MGVTVLLGACFHRCLCEWLPTSTAAATLLLAMILRECTMRKQASGRWRTSIMSHLLHCAGRLHHVLVQQCSIMALV